MEKFMQRKNVLLEYAATAQGQGLSENSPKTQNRGSDEMDFNDVFGGPPRRFSMQEVRMRYSFGEAADTEEERAMSPWSALKEKPVFGDESVGRRRHQVDEFYDDIFRGGDESYSSPRRSDLRDRDGVFGSNPGSRIMSPSRPLPAKTEPFGTSLPAQFSLPAKLTKAMELPTFGSQNDSQIKMEGSGTGLNSPHSSNGFSRFSNQPFGRMQDEVRNEAHSVRRQSPLSREASTDDLMSTVASHQKDNVENSKKDLKNSDGNGDHFHFSIYKWAGKGVPMLMPLVLGNNLRPKALNIEDRSTSLKESESDHSESKLSTATDEGGLSVHTEIESLKVGSEKNDKKSKEETTKMRKPFVEALDNKSDSDSRSDAKDNVSFGRLLKNLKVGEVRSLNEVDKKEKIKKTVPLKIKDPLKSAGKSLKIFLADEVEEPGNVTEKKEKKIKNSKGTRSNKHEGKNLNKNEEKESDSTKADDDKSGLHGANEHLGATATVKRGVKGKVKEFVQIFDVETDSNPKADFWARSQSFRWNAAGINQKDNGESNLNEVKEKESLHDANKKPDVTIKVDENLKKDKVEQSSQRTPSYRNRRNSVNQKKEFSSVMEDTKISVDNADDLFEDNFQVEELSEDHDNVTEKREDSEELRELDAKIRQWSVGKKGNIRSLLSTLQYVLWPGSGWKPVPLVDLIEANAVKRAYQKALLRIHPDKLQQKGAAASQKYTAEKVFDLLQEAWDHFNTLTPL